MSIWLWWTRAIALWLEDSFWLLLNQFCDVWFRHILGLFGTTLIVYGGLVALDVVTSDQLQWGLIVAASFVLLSYLLLEALHHRPAEYGPHQ